MSFPVPKHHIEFKVEDMVKKYNDNSTDGLYEKKIESSVSDLLYHIRRNFYLKSGAEFKVPGNTIGRHHGLHPTNVMISYDVKTDENSGTAYGTREGMYIQLDSFTSSPEPLKTELVNIIKKSCESIK